MTTYAQIRDGIVQRLYAPPTEFADLPLTDLMTSAVAEQMRALSEDEEAVVQEGWRYDGAVFTAPAPEPGLPSVPAEITRRQMLLAMAGAGLITGEEALAAATTGAVPAAIDAVFAELPADQALAARITWATMSVAERHHPLIQALIQAELATPEQVDAIFITGAAIP